MEKGEKGKASPKGGGHQHLWARGRPRARANDVRSHPQTRPRLDVVSIGMEGARRAKIASSVIKRSIDRRADHRVVMGRETVDLQAPTRCAIHGRKMASASSGISASFFTTTPLRQRPRRRSNPRRRLLPLRRGHSERATLRRRTPRNPTRTRRPRRGRGR